MMMERIEKMGDLVGLYIPGRSSRDQARVRVIYLSLNTHSEKRMNHSMIGRPRMKRHWGLMNQAQ